MSDKKVEDVNVKMTKDFLSNQKEFFVGVVKDYFAPVKTIFLFLSIPFELVRHFFISMAMDETEHERYHQMKFDDEVVELYEDGKTEEDGK